MPDHSHRTGEKCPYPLSPGRTLIQAERSPQVPPPGRKELKRVPSPPTKGGAQTGGGQHRVQFSAGPQRRGVRTPVSLAPWEQRSPPHPARRALTPDFDARPKLAFRQHDESKSVLLTNALGVAPVTFWTPRGERALKSSTASFKNPRAPAASGLTGAPAPPSARSPVRGTPFPPGPRPLHPSPAARAPN